MKGNMMVLLFAVMVGVIILSGCGSGKGGSSVATTTVNGTIKYSDLTPVADGLQVVLVSHVTQITEATTITKNGGTYQFTGVVAGSYNIKCQLDSQTTWFDGTLYIVKLNQSNQFDLVMTYPPGPPTEP